MFYPLLRTASFSLAPDVFLFSLHLSFPLHVVFLVFKLGLLLFGTVYIYIYYIYYIIYIYHWTLPWTFAWFNPEFSAWCSFWFDLWRWEDSHGKAKQLLEAFGLRPDAWHYRGGTETSFGVGNLNDGSTNAVETSRSCFFHNVSYIFIFLVQSYCKIFELGDMILVAHIVSRCWKSIL